jgi:hypothetical protein
MWRIGTGSECPVTSTNAVFRGRDPFSFSSWVLSLARLSERGVEGDGESSLGVVSVGKGSGSTGVDGPFPDHQLLSLPDEDSRRTSLHSSKLHQASENKIMLLNLLNHLIDDFLIGRALDHFCRFGSVT